MVLPGSARVSKSGRTQPRTTPEVGRAGPTIAQAWRSGHAERMSKVDTAWLRMDDASNLMMIVGVWVLRPGITYAQLSQRVQERLLKYPRFRQLAVEDAFGAAWLPGPQFSISNHVVRERPKPGPQGHTGAS